MARVGSAALVDNRLNIDVNDWRSLVNSITLIPSILSEDEIRTLHQQQGQAVCGVHGNCALRIGILQNGLYLYWINLYREPQPQQVNTRL